MKRAVIIDDEIAAVNALKLLMEKHIFDVKVVADTTECREGISLIEKHKPDIVFLDINMPDMNGFSLIKHVKYTDFSLVFTTAHERYAIMAIKHHASDYLVKPIDIDELKACIDTIKKSRDTGFVNTYTAVDKIKKLELSGRIGLPVKEGLVYVAVSDIVWIESDGNYCTFHITGSKKYIVSKNIGEYEELLPDLEFFRIHKSYLINVAKVKKYIRTDGYYVELEGGVVVEISRRKKDEFLQIMNSIN